MPSAFALAAATAAAAAAAAVAEAGSASVKVGLPLSNAAELDRLFTEVSTPGHPQYLNFITDPQELAERFGAPQQAVDAVVGHLTSKLGCAESAIEVSPTRDTVTCKELFVGDELLAKADLWDELRSEPLLSGFPTAVEFALVSQNHAFGPLEVSAPAVGGRRDRAARKSSAAQPNSFSNVANTKKAYGIPADLAASNPNSSQMVWGPGTFGYDESELRFWASENCPALNLTKIVWDTENHGTEGGDNFMEGQLDVSMVAAFGLDILTIVSNTNTSHTTEEGNGFGQALLDFVTDLYARDSVPHVLSMSLGSLSPASCDLLCSEAVKAGQDLDKCEAYLQTQRQVCMYLTQAQTDRINHGFQLLGLRGVTVLGASGDGGSHFSFEPFSGGGEMSSVLNKISCEFQFPVFPTSSPYVLSVGGEAWENGDMNKPVAWEGSGGGFSWQFPALAHQTETISNYLQTTHGLPAAVSFNASGRAYPDVAAISKDGTSQSCPTVAGILSLLIDHRLNQGLPPLGFIAPRLYQVATKYPGEAFQDIPTGNSKTSCSNGFPATSSWDPVTGWGRPQWAGLIKHFGSDNSSDWE
eukprot:INCI4631.1.p1 GENE.INCI4631.1~~INCI4631.1.p1  ORF type:complete len:605 (-),score=107.53 INCI4631.1:134-1885(-)